MRLICSYVNVGARGYTAIRHCIPDWILLFVELHKRRAAASRGFSRLWYIYTRSEKDNETARLYTQQEFLKELSELCSSAGVDLIS